MLKFSIAFQVRLNNTEELEARVTVLEESVTDLETNVVELIDEVDDIESSNILQEERLNTLDQEVNDNIDDIEGANFFCHRISSQKSTCNKFIFKCLSF